MRATAPVYGGEATAQTWDVPFAWSEMSPAAAAIFSLSEEIETLRYVDQAVGRLLATLPEDTMVIAFADHGMHRVQQEGRLGDHGHLIERDMLIPIWIVEP